MRICTKCKYICDNDMLQSCPKCKGELTIMEVHTNHLPGEDPSSSMYLSKQDRMYEDIHTIKNIMVAFITIFIIAVIFTAIAILG